MFKIEKGRCYTNRNSALGLIIHRIQYENKRYVKVIGTLIEKSNGTTHDVGRKFRLDKRLIESLGGWYEFKS